MEWWCRRRRDEFGNRHDELVGYMPPGHMCISESSANFRSLCCSDGVAVYCYTEDGAESYCTVESRPEFVQRFLQRFSELQVMGGYEIRGTTKFTAFTRLLR
jgi:hypothetical protein